jgi:hypothetical protein
MASDTSSPDTLKPITPVDQKIDHEVKTPISIEDIALSESVFDDDGLSTYYRPREDYEGYHRFDPKAVWTKEEEKALVRKIDWRIMAWCCIMFIALQLDRGNIGKQYHHVLFHVIVIHIIIF